MQMRPGLRTRRPDARVRRCVDRSRPLGFVIGRADTGPTGHDGMTRRRQRHRATAVVNTRGVPPRRSFMATQWASRRAIGTKSDPKTGRREPEEQEETGIIIIIIRRRRRRRNIFWGEKERKRERKKEREKAREKRVIFIYSGRHDTCAKTVALSPDPVTFFFPLFSIYLMRFLYIVRTHFLTLF